MLNDLYQFFKIDEYGISKPNENAKYLIKKFDLEEDYYGLLLVCCIFETIIHKVKFFRKHEKFEYFYDYLTDEYTIFYNTFYRKFRDFPTMELLEKKREEIETTSVVKYEVSGILGKVVVL